MLLPVLLQVALDSWQFLRSGRAKTSIFVDENDLGLLEVDDHVWIAVATHIDKAECHWHQIGACIIQLRTKIHARFGAISPGELDDLDTALQVDGDEVAGVAR